MKATETNEGQFMNRSLSDSGLDFEMFLRGEVPWLLNLSRSKQVAMNIKFYHFADFVRMLDRKASEEFKIFSEEFQNRFISILKWRAPRGTKIAPSIYQGELQQFPNGKIRYHLMEIERQKSGIR